MRGRGGVVPGASPRSLPPLRGGHPWTPPPSPLTELTRDSAGLGDLLGACAQLRLVGSASLSQRSRVPAGKDPRDSTRPSRGGAESVQRAIWDADAFVAGLFPDSPRVSPRGAHALPRRRRLGLASFPPAPRPSPRWGSGSHSPGDRASAPRPCRCCQAAPGPVRRLLCGCEHWAGERIFCPLWTYHPVPSPQLSDEKTVRFCV